MEQKKLRKSPFVAVTGVGFFLPPSTVAEVQVKPISDTKREERFKILKLIKFKFKNKI